jgi:hypothetical protein
MKRIDSTKLAAWGAIVAALVVTLASPVFALDAYRDRKGLFTGAGLGGGVAVQDGEPGGEILLELAAGGGASERLTFALDLDIWFQLIDDRQNWLVVPGPELNYFLTDGLFLRAGVGMVLAFVRGEKVDDVATPGTDVEDNDFALGFDGSLGLGYEFFVSSNLALGLAVEGDYFLIDDHDDVLGASFSVGIRYY